jgi:hypothetical protein
MSLRQCFSQALPSIVKDMMVSSRFVQIKHVSVKYVALSPRLLISQALIIGTTALSPTGSSRQD